MGNALKASLFKILLTSVCFDWGFLCLCIRVCFRKQGHACDFSEEGQKKVKKCKIFENLGKNVQNLKISWKRAGDCVWLLKAIKC